MLNSIVHTSWPGLPSLPVGPEKPGGPDGPTVPCVENKIGMVNGGGTQAICVFGHSLTGGPDGPISPSLPFSPFGPR